MRCQFIRIYRVRHGALTKPPAPPPSVTSSAPGTGMIAFIRFHSSPSRRLEKDQFAAPQQPDRSGRAAFQPQASGPGHVRRSGRSPRSPAKAVALPACETRAALPDRATGDAHTWSQTSAPTPCRLTRWQRPRPVAHPPSSASARAEGPQPHSPPTASAIPQAPLVQPHASAPIRATGAADRISTARSCACQAAVGCQGSDRMRVSAACASMSPASGASLLLRLNVVS